MPCSMRCGTSCMARRRGTGTTLRETGRSPRQLGTNPSAGTASDRRRVANLKARALWALGVSGRRWCELCDDSGWRSTAIAGEVERCGCEPITAREAQAILNDCQQAPSVAVVASWERRAYR